MKAFFRSSVAHRSGTCHFDQSPGTGDCPVPARRYDQDDTHPTKISNARAFLFIETQFDNLGDALINRELIKLMARHAKVTVGTSKVPEPFQVMIGKNILHEVKLDRTSGRSRFLLKILGSALRGKACWLFLSPGGWIGELDGRLNLRSWFHTLLYFVLSGCGVRVCQTGVSYEALGPKLSRLISKRSKAVYCHYVRDTLSKTLMESLNVNVNGLCPDLAFNAYCQPSQRINPAAVTFSFRTDQYLAQADDVKKFIVFFMSEYGLSRPVYFISQVKKDINANESLAHWFEARFAIAVRAEQGTVSISETELLYHRSNIVVSNRLHSLLLAGSVGNAMIAAPIGLQNAKIISLFEDTGLDEQVFAIDDLAYANTRSRLEMAQRNIYRGDTERLALQTIFNNMFQVSGGSR